MKLSDLVLNPYIADPRSAPSWLWHVARSKDLNVIQVEGLLGSPHIFLTSDRNSAISCHPGNDRILVRVRTKDLDLSKLLVDNSWSRWVRARRKGNTDRLPPLELIMWWSKLRRNSNPKSSSRLASLASKGTWNDLLEQDFRQPMRHIHAGQLWSYQTLIKPTSLSVEHKGFYVAVQNPSTQEMT